MYTLGINAAFHDSAAALVQDGRLIAAVEEERLSRIKHAKRPIPFTTHELPFLAIAYCLEKAKITAAEVDHFAYSFDPRILLDGTRAGSELVLPLRPNERPVPEGLLSEWDPLFLCSILNAPRLLAAGAPHHIKSHFVGLPETGPKNWHFVEHHIAHAASAFHASPHETAAVLTLDGRGERATTMYALGSQSDLQVLGTVELPHSLGLLYEELTRYLGFLHSSDEYKVMALAAFGKPVYVDFFRDAIQLREGGDYQIRPFSFTEQFGPPRERGALLTQLHFDLAHSLQRVLEERVLEICRWLQRETGARRLCMAGGVALNCVMNSVIRDRGPFDSVWVQPAAGDAGTALGAALWIDARERQPSGGRRWAMDHAFWGPEHRDEEIESFLRWAKVKYRRPARLAEDVAELLLQDKVIGWMQGRMEFGPRALGARSILASPLSPSMQERLNEIKDREDFRPVAPVVLEEEADSWFDCREPSPFMLFVHDVRPEKKHLVPAICHADCTARVQTINREQNQPYYELLCAFAARTEVPILVNTSFNSRGEPIVCSPRDALECFWSSPLDALAIGPFLIEKE